jgi:hypothetical protein
MRGNLQRDEVVGCELLEQVDREIRDKFLRLTNHLFEDLSGRGCDRWCLARPSSQPWVDPLRDDDVLALCVAVQHRGE